MNTRNSGKPLRRSPWIRVASPLALTVAMAVLVVGFAVASLIA